MFPSDHVAELHAPPHFRVQRPSGDTLYFEAKSHHIVADLWQEVVDTWKVPPNCQLRLAMDGCVLGLSTPLCELSPAVGIDAVVVSRQVPFDVGEICIVNSIATVRKEESFASPVVDELAIGEKLEILEVGHDRRRRRIACPPLHGLHGGEKSLVPEKRDEHVSGWISFETRLGEPLILRQHCTTFDTLNHQRLVLDRSATFECLDLDQRLVLDRAAILHAKESLDSDVVAVLRKNTSVITFEYGSAGRNLRVVAETEQSDEGTVKGWLIGSYFDKPRIARPAHLQCLQCLHFSLCCNNLGPDGCFLLSFNHWKQLLQQLRKSSYK